MNNRLTEAEKAAIMDSLVPPNGTFVEDVLAEALASMLVTNPFNVGERRKHLADGLSGALVTAEMRDAGEGVCDAIVARWPGWVGKNIAAAVASK